MENLSLNGIIHSEHDSSSDDEPAARPNGGRLVHHTSESSLLASMATNTGMVPPCPLCFESLDDSGQTSVKMACGCFLHCFCVARYVKVQMGDKEAIHRNIEYALRAGTLYNAVGENSEDVQQTLPLFCLDRAGILCPNYHAGQCKGVDSGAIVSGSDMKYFIHPGDVSKLVEYLAVDALFADTTTININDPSLTHEDAHKLHQWLSEFVGHTNGNFNGNDQSNSSSPYFDDAASASSVGSGVASPRSQSTSSVRLASIRRITEGPQVTDTSPRIFESDDLKTQRFIEATTKPCPTPNCSNRSSHWHLHGCHHIFDGCQACRVKYCYRCLSTAPANRARRGAESNCECGYWSTFCGSLRTATEIDRYLALEPFPHDIRCGCPICPSCKPGDPCFPGCECSVCAGLLFPGPSSLGGEPWVPYSPEMRTQQLQLDASEGHQSAWIDPIHGRFYALCRRGQIDAASEMLFNNLIDPNTIYEDGSTALHEVSGSGYIELVRSLLESRAHVDSLNRANQTPLYSILRHGDLDESHIEVMRFLIEKGASLSTTVNNDGCTPLYRALVKGHWRAAKLLIEMSDNNTSGVLDISVRGGNALHYICEKDKEDEEVLEIVDLLLVHKADSNLADEFGETALSIAAKQGLPSRVVDALIHHGATVFASDQRAGRLPFKIIFHKDSLECHLSNVVIASCHGSIMRQNPLESEIARTLICQNAFEGITDALGNACREGHLELLSQLLSANGDKEASKVRITTMSSLLRDACRHRRLAIARFLIKEGGVDACAMVGAVDPVTGDSALHVACRGYQPYQADTKALITLLIETLQQKGSYAREVVNLLNHHGDSTLHQACRHGHLEIVKQLLDLGASISQPSHTVSSIRKVVTPLEEACRAGHFDLVRFLWSSDFINSMDHATTINSCLVIAHRSNHRDISRFLIDKGASLEHICEGSDESDEENDTTQLHVACNAGHVKAVTLALKSGGGLACTDHAGATPLHKACQSGNQKLVELLLNSHRVSNDVVDSEGYTPLYCAYRMGHGEIATLLLDSGVTDSFAPDGTTLLHVASMAGHMSVAKIQLDLGIPVNTQKLDGSAPLHDAVQFGQLKLASFLLDRGALVNIADSRGITAIHIASRLGNTKLVRLLVTRGSVVNAIDAQGDSPFLIACRERYWETAHFLLERRVDVALGRSYNEQTPAHLACGDSNCPIEFIQLLLDHMGATVHLSDLLRVACFSGHLSAARLLLDRGAVITSLAAVDTSSECTRLLYQACRAVDLEVAHILLDSKSKAIVPITEGPSRLNQACLGHRFLKPAREFLDYFGTGHLEISSMLKANSALPIDDTTTDLPLLHCACFHDNADLCALLLDRGASINFFNDSFDAPLHIACDTGYVNVAKTLLQRRDIDINIVESSRGFTPMHVACNSGHLKLVRLLIKHKASLDVRDLDGKTPLLRLCDRLTDAREPIIRLLLESNADCHIPDLNLNTPLHIASKGHDGIVSLLLQWRAPVNVQNNTGETALHVACRAGRSAVVKLLCESNATVNARDNQGISPLYLARKSTGPLSILQTLLDHGATAV